MVTRLPFPFFGAVAALWFAPDYLTRERQEFKEEGHSFNPRTARKQGLAAYGQTVGVPSSLSPPRTRQSPALRRAQLPAEVQRKTPRPLGANTLAQFVYPAKSVQKRLPPRQSVSLTRLVCSGHPVQKRCRPDRVNRLRGSSAPVNQRKIMDSCRCSTNTTCRSTPNLLQ